MTAKHARAIAFEIAVIALLVCVFASVVSMAHRKVGQAAAHQVGAAVRPLPQVPSL